MHRSPIWPITTPCPTTFIYQSSWRYREIIFYLTHNSPLEKRMREVPCLPPLLSFRVIDSHLMSTLSLMSIPMARKTQNREVTSLRDNSSLQVPLSEGDTDTSLIGSDFMKLFDAKLTSFDFSKWPSVIKYVIIPAITIFSILGRATNDLEHPLEMC